VNLSTKKIVAIGVFVVITFGIIAFVSIKRFEKEAEINAQTEVEKTKIEQEANVQRTRERMHWLPWYKDEENKQ